MPAGPTLIYMAGDDTAAGLAPGTPTVVDAPLAYSEVIEDEPVREPWRVVGRRAAAMVLVGTACAGGVVLGWLDRSARGLPVSTPVAAAQPVAGPVREVEPQPVDPSAAKTLVAADASVAIRMVPPGPDAVYLTQLDRVNVHWSTAAESIRNGHLVCRSLEEGDSFQTVAIQILSLSGPGVTYGQVAEAVGAAIYAYCPQYQR